MKKIKSAKQILENFKKMMELIRQYPPKPMPQSTPYGPWKSDDSSTIIYPYTPRFWS